MEIRGFIELQAAFRKESRAAGYPGSHEPFVVSLQGKLLLAIFKGPQ